MKSIYIIILSIFVTACGEEFLDLQPESVADIEDIYRTEDDFFQAIIGAYDELQSSGQYGRNFQFLFETRSDIIGESSAGFQDGIYYEVDRFLLRTENPLLQQSWASLYSGIYRSNIILERLQEAGLESEFKDQIRAEARFIRALSCFNVVRLWGDAPLLRNTITPDQALEVRRNSVDEIYNFLQAELEQITEILPDTYTGENLGRATKYAALALLAKVQLESDLHSAAEATLEEIITSGLFTLQADFGNTFDLQNEMNDEIIFAIRWKRQVEETNLFFSRATNPITVDQGYLDSFDPSDNRLEFSQLTNIGSYTIPAKFNDPAGSNGKTGLDFPVFRYADVLLMYAEAINEQNYQSSGAAFDALNEVRTRAGLASLTSSTITNQSEFRTALLDERRKELIFEGQSWFDLIRLGNPIQTFANMGININEGRFVYPIPQSEINRINSSSFSQNEAYQ